MFLTKKESIRLTLGSDEFEKLTSVLRWCANNTTPKGTVPGNISMTALDLWNEMNDSMVRQAGGPAS